MINGIIISLGTNGAGGEGVPAGITVDTTIYKVDSTLIKADNG